jgi:hypothetical protein
MNRTINVLNYTAASLVLGWLVVGSIGGMLGSMAVLEVGIWLLIAAYPVYAALIVLVIVELTPWYRRRERQRFLAHLDDIQRKARLSAIYRLRRYRLRRV